MACAICCQPLDGGGSPAVPLRCLHEFHEEEGMEHKKHQHHSIHENSSSLSKRDRLCVQLSCWASYFNNTLNCWEPLLEYFDILVMYETCILRGRGLLVQTRAPVHLNVTGALTETLGDALRIATRIRQKLSHDLQGRYHLFLYFWLA